MAQWSPRVTVAAVVEQAGRFLLVEESVDDRQLINQPAGHLEAGETLLAAVRRETLEETAWYFEPTDLIGVYRWTHPTHGTTFLRFAFTGELTGHDPNRGLDRDISRVLWLTAAEVRTAEDRLRSPQVCACIDDYLAGCRYPLQLLNDIDS